MNLDLYVTIKITPTLPTPPTPRYPASITPKVYPQSHSSAFITPQGLHTQTMQTTPPPPPPSCSFLHFRPLPPLSSTPPPPSNNVAKSCKTEARSAHGGRGLLLRSSLLFLRLSQHAVAQGEKRRERGGERGGKNATKLYTASPPPHPSRREVTHHQNLYTLHSNQSNKRYLKIKDKHVPPEHMPASDNTAYTQHPPHSALFIPVDQFL